MIRVVVFAVLGVSAMATRDTPLHADGQWIARIGGSHMTVVDLPLTEHRRGS